MSHNALNLITFIMTSTSVCFGSGYGAVVTLTDNKQWPNQIYAGTRAAVNGHATQIDIPFSLIVDTAVLPYTIPRTIYNLSQREDQQQLRGNADASKTKP